MKSALVPSRSVELIPVRRKPSYRIRGIVRPLNTCGEQMMKMRTALIPAVTLALIACSGGAGGSSYSTPTDPYGNQGTTGTTTSASTIQATDGLAFNPSSLTVSKGTTVTFAFGSITHNVAFGAGSGVADIPDSYGTSVERTFNTAGTFAFRCSIHNNMTGQITIQ
jgi:plastocyanin